MTSRQIISDTLAGKPTERIPLTDISFWPETIARWQGEGLPPAADMYDYFGLDRIFFYYPDASPAFAEKTLEENETFAIVSDSFGRQLRKWKNKTAPPENIHYAVRDIGEALEYIRQYDSISLDRRSDLTRVEDYAKASARGDFRAFAPLEPAWFVIEYLLGFEQGLTAFVEYPSEVRSIMERLTDFSLDRLELLIEKKKLRFDALWFFADLCYRNGMLFSPSVYREIIRSIHLKYRRFCDRHNLFLMLHCDGDIREFIPLLLETGFDAIQPLEARAGNDVRELKVRYGNRITFFGNINADVIASGTRDQIVAEVTSKVNAAKKGGRYIYHIDHSVPPTVSLANYRLLIETLNKVMYL